MRGCPQNCTVCEFESSCDSGMYMDGCRFYPPIRRVSITKAIITSLKEPLAYSSAYRQHDLGKLIGFGDMTFSNYAYAFIFSFMDNYYVC